MIKRADRGMTLLEMLVVLTLTGMVSALLFQGYGYMLGGYQRLQNRQATEFERGLVESWWRNSLESLVPYFEDDLRFSGEDFELHGATFSPVRGVPGVATEFSWELRPAAAGTELHYLQPPFDAQLIKRWDEGEQVSFRFLDQTGNWLPRWMVKKDGRQLPESVQLVIRPADGEALTTVTAVVPIRKTQEIPSSVLLYGRE
jgi:prepilin-type N-terminal cleavage/methylation domain-containing protein